MLSNKFEPKKVFLSLVGLALLCGILINIQPNSLSKWLGNYSNLDNFTASEVVKDAQSVTSLGTSFADLSEYFINLANDKSAVYAYEVLKQADLPPGTDVHLLGHVVGDELYKQEGFSGMRYCTPDFRNACSHTIVIGALLERGDEVFDVVNDVCREAPGGPGAYTMCFHGFGHGVLAYVEYEFPEVIDLCRRVGTKEHNNEEFHQCVGGAVMEMYEGVHDLELWNEKKNKYLDNDDPLRLCQADYMPQEAKYFCYSYITPYMYDAAGAERGNPRPEHYEKAFRYCESEPDESLRSVCYAGFGKEFVVLAQDRDVRAMDEITSEQLKLVISWCQLAEVPMGVEACLMEVQNSLYWGGENNYLTSINYCSLLDEQDMQGKCFVHMFNNVNYYERNQMTRDEICQSTPRQHQDQCRTVLKSRN